MPEQGKEPDVRDIPGERTDGTERPRRGDVEHTDDRTGELGNCCAFLMTLVNRKPPFPLSLLPFFKPWKLRVTGTSGTTILNADPDVWDQTTSLPTSLVWHPGTNAPIPYGDPSELWTIDNEFLLELGPSHTGVKSLKVEWLRKNGSVLGADRIEMPCAPVGGIDDETVWKDHTTRLSGPPFVLAFMEPDECDPDAFEFERSSCSITEDLKKRQCISSPGQNSYSVILTCPAISLAAGYQWTISGGPLTGSNVSVTTTTTNTKNITLPPSVYSCSVTIVDGSNNLLSVCTGAVEILEPTPHFTAKQADCSTKVELDASGTSNADLVTSWTWTCSDPQVQIPDGRTTSFTAPALGSYDVTLKAKNGGCTWEEIKSIAVVECAASFTVDYSWCVGAIDERARTDVEVTFTNTSMACNATWKWDFGDGSGSSDRDPKHVYANVRHGDVFDVTLSLEDSKGCSSSVVVALTITQRLSPDISVKVCPDGKVIFKTTAMLPRWFPTGSPNIAPEPYTRPDRIVYRFSPGSYSMTLESINANSNKCSRTVSFVVHHDCCTKNAFTRGTSSPVTVTLGSKKGPKTVTLRVKGRFRQYQDPFVHRIKARTRLQRKGSMGWWRGFSHQDVSAGVQFSGKIYRSESSITDAGFFTGCNCALETEAESQSVVMQRSRVRVAQGWNDEFRSKLDSMGSDHWLEINSTQQTSVHLSLGKEKDCSQFKWWLDWL